MIVNEGQIDKIQKDTDYRFNNNFDFLRIFAAILVIFSHSFPLADYHFEPFFLITGSMSFGTLGVIIFFVISGYLITKSWDRNPSTTQFFWNRFLRIVPGLAGVALFSIFLIGPLVTTLSISNYFQNPQTWNYLKIITIFGIGSYYTLPGVFTSNILPDAVNGSLWTLPLEFKMYILVFITGFTAKFLKLHNKTILVIILVILFGFFFYSNQNFYPMFYHNIFYWTGGLNEYLIPPLFFFIGVIYYIYEKYIIYNFKISIALLIIWILSFNTPFFSVTSFISLPYLILFIAKTPIHPLNKTSKYGDFSYGLYIYAFPIQQSIYYFINGISFIGMFLISLILTFLLAFLSWHIIESKALKLKKFNFHSYLMNNNTYRLIIYPKFFDIISYLQRFNLLIWNKK